MRSKNSSPSSPFSRTSVSKKPPPIGSRGSPTSRAARRSGSRRSSGWLRRWRSGDWASTAWSTTSSWRLANYPNTGIAPSASMKLATSAFFPKWSWRPRTRQPEFTPAGPAGTTLMTTTGWTGMELSLPWSLPRSRVSLHHHYPHYLLLPSLVFLDRVVDRISLPRVVWERDRAKFLS